MLTPDQLAAITSPAEMARVLRQVKARAARAAAARRERQQQEEEGDDRRAG